MKMSHRQFSLILEIFLPAGLIMACLELLWNLAVDRIPIYWLPTYLPLPAILLNALIHVILTIAPAVVLGFVVILIKRPGPRKASVPIAAGAYIYYMSCTALLRFLNLKNEFPPRGRLALEVILLILVVLGTLIWWRATRARRRRKESLAGPATVTMSVIVALVVIFLRRPLSSWVYLSLAAAIIVLAHLVLWYLSRRRHPSPRFLGLCLLILAVLGVLARGAWASRGSPKRSPHIVVLVWDAVRADRMSLYGYKHPTTPFAASLAKKGLIFRQAYSTANFTFPSHVSIFTGLYARAHGLWQGIVPEITRYFQLHTVAGDLKRKGYRTLLFSENPWIAYLWKGFDYYYWTDIRGVPVASWHGPVSKMKATPATLPPFMGNCPSPFLARQVIDQVQQACEGYYKYTIDNYGLRVLEEQLILRGSGHPVFFFLNWMNVHNRYYPSGDHREGETIAPYDWSKEYDRALVYIDQRLKKLLGVFKRAGELDRMVLILASDHGELLGEYNLYGHMKTLFQPVLRVPLLISSHKWTRGEIVEKPVSLTGLKKVCAILAEGINNENEIIDRSAKSFSADQVVVSEHRTLEPRDGRYLRGWMCLDRDLNKIIFDEELPFLGSTWGKTSRFLFDLKGDPLEKRNLYISDTDLRDRMLNRYRTWEEDTHPALPVNGGKEIPEGLRERLRALGYVK